MSIVARGLFPELSDSCSCADLTSTAFDGVQKMICPMHRASIEQAALEKFKASAIEKITNRHEATKILRAVLPCSSNPPTCTCDTAIRLINEVTV